jgi:hypothetical protein
MQHSVNKISNDERRSIFTDVFLLKNKTLKNLSDIGRRLQMKGLRENKQIFILRISKFDTPHSRFGYFLSDVSDMRAQYSYMIYRNLYNYL